VLDYQVNRGKTTILNEGVKELKGDIVVFSDAAALLYQDSVRKLLENFADPEVGAVSGKYVVVKADEVDVGKSEDVYWKYETFLKVQESELSSSLGAHGHLHAIRKALYPGLPPGTINDDYIIPVSVLGKGYRAVYEPTAIVYEEAREMTGFGRRVRIMAGNLQQLREIKSVLRPFLPLPLFFFLSHKVSRLLVPFGMVAALLANLFLLNEPIYQALFIGQAVFYLIALAGTMVKLRPKAIMLPFYFCMINAATFFGLYHALTSRRKMAWK
jgi:biofilm PGA synthesis N-glycosyltransferase PgaC